ncbi:hypothetical protein C8J57DRAFT_1611754 [Mycena rebaudengoi]|nr:hypothetical protein C8J57DRAFT_1611754 [Mycena rebaudengoi]
MSTDLRVPKLSRTLFAQDIFNEDSPVRPVYEKDRESYTEITPPRSPLARFNNGSPLETLFFSASTSTPKSSPTTLIGSPDETISTYGTIPSPRGLVRARLLTFSLGTDMAMQEIWCEYCTARDLYLQFIQFSLGGISDPQAQGTISPKAVFRTWAPKKITGVEEPFWVKYHLHNGYALRDVSIDFAVGRVALLAYCTENTAISNDLLNWAQKASLLPPLHCIHRVTEAPDLHTAAAARRLRKRVRLNADAPPQLPEAGPSQIEHNQSEPEFSHSEPEIAPDFEPTPAPAPAEVPPEAPSGRGRRAKRPTWKILEQLPPAPAEFEDVSLPDPPPDTTPPPTLTEYVWESVKTVKNAFGVYREYPTLPTHDPDRTTSLSDQSNIPGPRSEAVEARLTPVFATETPFGPFKNSTVFGLMNWIISNFTTRRHRPACRPFSSASASRLFAFDCDVRASGSVDDNSNGYVPSARSPLSKIADARRPRGIGPEAMVCDEFRKEDLEGFDIQSTTKQFDKSLAESVGSVLGDASGVKDGWREVEVEIEVPDGKNRTKSNHGHGPVPVFSVPGLHHRNLTQVIKSVLEDRSSRFFHYTPFKQFWQPSPDQPAQQIYDEIYSSAAFLDAHAEIQRQPAEPGCTLERVIAALMFWSDSTHLANFGTASLWPLYLFFGNQSKWVRGKPRAGACHHVAYMPKLPDSFFTWFRAETGHSPSAELLTHCRRELMHAIWRLLLNGEFIEACKHGIVINCPDGIQRRFYFRVFTYSADYPEKVLLATIRNLGACPCPRCLISKAKLDELGTGNDDRRRERLQREDTPRRQALITRAREFIYSVGKKVRSAAVERLLDAQSLVPTVNAFTPLAAFGLSIFVMLVVDFMHEFELGVWKAIFTHLLRILVAHGEDVVQVLNDRYNMVPTFGNAVIRPFKNNVSGMKKLAARNFEDILQCALPVFEDLLDEPHNKIVQDLLFTLAYWHGLAKLRLHTDSTLNTLKDVTTQLGRQLRYFRRVTCAAFTTHELPSEEAARGRRRAKKAAAASAEGAPPPPPSEGKRLKIFNMFTYKGHSLGDYFRTIRFFGTVDSYSTQPVSWNWLNWGIIDKFCSAQGELEHRRVKRYYARTNRNDAVGQITQLERREAALLKIARDQQHAQNTPPIETIETPSNGTKRKRPGTKPAQTVLPTVDFAETEALPYTPPEAHYHISQSRNYHFNIQQFLTANYGDPAVKDFLPKLKEHLLGRMIHPTWSGDGEEFTPQERDQVTIVNNRIYRHKVCRINYTSYDVRRCQDTMNPRTHSDFMMLAPEDIPENAHPFVYARILGVFHCDAIRLVAGVPAAAAVPFTFLWVRRFRLDSTFQGGFKRKRLHRIEFYPDSDPRAFGFVDPDEVIRASHLIPAFAHQGTTPVSYTSLARQPKEFDDWKFHYVNFFVDRDMLMRYLGGGVGHSHQVRVPEADAEPTAAEQEQDDAESVDGDEPYNATASLNAHMELPSS